jgi:transcription regulator MmyB-like protein
VRSGALRLIGELSTRSQDFRARWAAHDVRIHRFGVKQLRHSLVGELTLSYQALDIPADPGLTIVGVLRRGWVAA